ncbi:gp436 family protein [Halodurantibacterium flavum]|uniref:Gp436 family protein n=1 Tax=Halodurantibacterium flavum TaxID=1382802 RepID=A0ABW4S996_9RHOB
MTYATLQGLTDRYGQDLIVMLTDRSDPPAGTVDADAVTRALLDTDGVIDGYLRARYVTPLPEVPPQITDIALSIAVYKLHRYSPEAKIKDDYEGAIRALREIAAGTIVLTAATTEPTPSGGTGARITDRERPLSAENLKGFI